MIIYSFLNSLI
jgi:hypothetical protein